MTEAMVVSLARDALTTAFHISLPMLAVALTVGVLVSLFQVATSIQDPTLTFVPKILGVLAALLLFLNTMAATMIEYTSNILTGIPGMVR